jgi:hypothetical protein
VWKAGTKKKKETDASMTTTFAFRIHVSGGARRGLMDVPKNYSR